MKFHVRLAVLAAACAATPVFAAERIWDGGGGGLNGITLWENSANWVNDLPPAPGDDALFAQSFGQFTRVNLAGDRTINKLAIFTTQSFSLENFGGAGNTLTLGSGDIQRTNSASNAHTITSNIALANPGAWEIGGGGGGLTVSGRITGTSTAGLYKTGNATLTLTNDVTLARGLTAAGGTVEVVGGAHLDTNTALDIAQYVAESGGTLSLKGGSSLSTRGYALVHGGGSVRLSDASTRWVNAPAAGVDIIAVGVRTNGTIAVENGATIFSPNTDIFVGDEGGTGGLTIKGGSAVTSRRGVIGIRSDGQGSVTVSGVNSKWTTNSLALGEGAGSLARSARLTVESGASAVSANTHLNIDGAVLTVSGGTFTTDTLSSPAGVSSRLALSDASGNAALTVVSGDYAGSIVDAAAGPGSVLKTGPGTLVLRGPLSYTGATRVTQGSLEIAAGLTNPGAAVTVASGGTLLAQGFVNRVVGGAGVVRASGTLLLGDVTRTDGVALAGPLNVGAHAVTLLDADRATLGHNVLLSSGGRLSSFAGIDLTGTLVAGGPATVFNNFTNNGTVDGPLAAGQTLTFQGLVNGGGSYSGRVTFAGGFSPGNSPANVSLGTAEFGDANVLTMELAGTTPGSQYDRLTVTGGLSLGGDLNVVLLGGFSPAFGQSFTLLSGPITGAFDRVTLPSLAGGLSWQTAQTADAYTLTVVPEPATLAAVSLAMLVLGRRRRIEAAKEV